MTEDYAQLDKSELIELLAGKGQTIKDLKETIESLKKRLFGRKSEKRSNLIKAGGENGEPNSDLIKEESKRRRKLMDDCFKNDSPVVEADSAEVAVGILPDSLERRIEVIDLKPADWSEETYRELEAKITERLMYTPAKYYVKRYVRPVYVRKLDSLIQPVAPARFHVLGRCSVDITVLIKIIIDRF
jgi:hypothetical protein